MGAPPLLREVWRRDFFSELSFTLLRLKMPAMEGENAQNELWRVENWSAQARV